MELRKHQRDGRAIAAEVVEGTVRKKIITAAVTPGGGKTALAAIMANTLIDGGVVDRVCVVCPRDSLRSQVADGFVSDSLGLKRAIRSDKDKRQSDGQGSFFVDHGFATTYQAIVADPRKFEKRLKRHRYLLVLDEPHHLVDDENEVTWKRAIEPLVVRAEKVLLMSGTIRRHDKKRIPFVEYGDDKRPIVDIRYTRREALIERAIIQSKFTLWNGSSAYEYRGKHHSHSLANAPSGEQARTLKNALLDPDYGIQLAMHGLREWLDYRQSVYPSRAIVIVHSQDAARRMSKAIHSRLPGVNVALAISDEPRSHTTIQRFRDKLQGDVLVTVGMAYEGLDVPSVTHLVCLTDTRSEPWLDQAFARASRFDASANLAWDKQRASVYVPDDARMRKFIDTILEAQDEAYSEHAPSGKIVPIRNRSSFIPGSAEIGVESFGDDEGRLNTEESAMVASARERHPGLRHMPPREVLALIYDLRKGA